MKPAPTSLPQRNGSLAGGKYKSALNLNQPEQAVHLETNDDDENERFKLFIKAVLSLTEIRSFPPSLVGRACFAWATLPAEYLSSKSDNFGGW